LGSTPGCEARNSTSGGAAYSRVVCRKQDIGKGKDTVCPATFLEGSIHSADQVHTNVSNKHAASIFMAEFVGVKIQCDLCCWL